MKQPLNKLIYLIFLIGLISISQSCKKDTLLSSSNITFSADTLVFDTIFKTEKEFKDLFKGSGVQQVKIYNPDTNPLILEEVELMGGSASPFRINLDGLSGKIFTNKKISGHDSLFMIIDIQLNVLKNPSPTPIIRDSIRVKTNGKNQYLQLVAWGQDAYFHHKETIKHSTEWKNDKPHVVIGYTIIDTLATLDVQQGCKIHLYNNSLLYVRKGALNMNGTINNKIIVQGTRPEASYQKIAGQYYGIYFHEALPSKISYTHIKNGTSAIQIYSRDASSDLNTLTLENTIIENNAKYGIFCFANPKIALNNVLLYRNQIYSFFVLQGAEFSINHSTILGYGPSTKDNTAFALKNYYTNPDDQITYISPLNGTIKNTIIYGYKPSEYVLDTLQNEEIQNTIKIQNSLLKLETPFTSSSVSFNLDPKFININQNNFRFNSSSPLNNNGIPSSIKTDIEGKPRSNTSPDIGVYEID